MDLILLFLTLAAGFLMPIQPAVNAVTAQWVRSSYVASFFSFLTGTLALAILCLLLRQTFPSARTIADLPWWAWTAGPMGAFFVTMTILAVPRLGAMSVMALIIAGQMAMSLILDHYGWFGVPSQPITVWRILGGLMLLAGVMLIRR